MKYIKRILVILPLFIILVVNAIWGVGRALMMFILYGGEWITHIKSDQKNINDIYLELIRQDEKRKK